MVLRADATSTRSADPLQNPSAETFISPHPHSERGGLDLAKAVVLLATAALALIPLAGCLAADEAGLGSESLDPSALPGSPAPGLPELPSASPGSALAGGRGQAPEWTIGDWWSYGDEGFEGAISQQMVVAGSQGTDYLAAASTADVAIWDAIYDSFLIGRIDKESLGVRVKGRLLPFYDFPLYDNKTWASSTPEGEPMKVTARAAEITTPKGRFQGFEISATQLDGTRVAWDYTDEIRYFSQILITSKDGTVVFKRTLKDSGTEYSGSTFTATAKLLLENEWTAPLNEGTFDVAQDFATLHLTAGFRGTGSVGFLLFDPDNQIAYQDGRLGQDLNEWDQAQLSPTRGTWRAEAGVFGQGSVFLRILGIAVQEGSL